MSSSCDIRKAFTGYFERHGHLLMPTASLVPADKTLLFTNAGMVPFKQVFTGLEHAPAGRVTTVQRCVRAGGKHNDLENVGVTTRHHTLFEMLGNFSFGDYFKEQAILYAWEFITKVCQIDSNRLWVTYYETDLETKAIWHKQIGVPEDRLIACGAKDNFWSMGATGPCGPCTEIFYDHGPEIAGGPPGSPDEDGDRFVEVWNLVFMQYNTAEDGARSDLPKPCVDTGSGLERLAAVLQGVHDNYEIDQFQRLIKIIESLQTSSLSVVSKRVVADHVRAIACLIQDGVRPSNEGRGYVLRRLLRRAACFLHRDGQISPMLANVIGEACVDPLLSVMHQRDLAATIALVRQEEEQFISVVEQGNRAIAELIASGVSAISGAQAFKLYDTYGLPFDLTKDLATASRIAVDEAGFHACMSEQKDRSRQSANFAQHSISAKHVSGETEFVGYEQITSTAKIIGIYNQDWQAVEAISNGVNGHIVLDQSVFYAESGGQVADTGKIAKGADIFTVEDAQKYQSAIVLSGKANGQFAVGDNVLSSINKSKRQDTARNHSATHLLHAALRNILGEHVEQKGSLVNSEILRFDFAHNKPLTIKELSDIECWVTDKIRANLPVTTTVTSFENAKKQGAMALFEGKYGDNVRLLSMGEVSLELCGGTHVQSLAEIGVFVITAETGVAAGIRRITAITGKKADQFIADTRNSLTEVAEHLGTNNSQVLEKLTAVQNKTNALQQQVQAITEVYASARVKTAQTNEQFLTIEPITDANILAAMADKIIKVAPAVILLSEFNAGKHLLIVQSKQEHFKAGDFIKFLAKHVSAKGGGKPNYARGQIQEQVSLIQLKDLLNKFQEHAN